MNPDFEEFTAVSPHSPPPCNHGNPHSPPPCNHGNPNSPPRREEEADYASDDSRHTADLFSNYELIEKEIAGFLDSEKEQCQTFKLICEWEGCEESFTSGQNPLFLHHVQSHVHEECDKITAKTIQKYVCKWVGCAKPDINTRQELEFARHVLYHPYHQKLKLRGLLALQAHRIFVPCQLDEALSDLVPEFPTHIFCQWEECEFKCNCITSFEDHLKFHVYEQGKEEPRASRYRNPKALRRSRGRTHYTCKWRGCPNMTTPDILQMYRHTQTHSNLREYACNKCGTLFCSKETFLDHHRRQATEESGYILSSIVFQCNHCQKKYPSESILKSHMRGHIYNYMCQYCQSTFSKQCGLRKHIIYRHRKERKWACQFKGCEYRAKDRGDLEKHVERLHSIRQPFKCKESECSYSCLNEDTYQIHLRRRHSDTPKNYLCHECSRLFSEGRCLSRHLIRIHDYSRPSGAGKFRYTLHSDGNHRLQTSKYESEKLVAIKELQRKAESSLLALGLSPSTDMDLVIRTEDGEEQQLKFVSYQNAMKELNSEEGAEEEDEGSKGGPGKRVKEEPGTEKRGSRRVKLRLS